MHDEQRARGKSAARPGDPPRLLDGRYLIGDRIARGGMASVYEALDTRLDRTVAVKMMHPGLGEGGADDDSFARRFVREAKAVARLSHPNVVAVYDQGRDESDGDGGTTYLVMEYVPGHTLRDTIAKEAPMPPQRALALLEPVLSALAAAHRAGLVHRDVKPENVLIATEPGGGSSRVKVADFGLARAVTAETQHTATNGVLIGTVSYLAPELVVEQQADARADVYAAGVICFELLTGTKPHTGETPIAVAYRHVHHDVPPPSSVVPGIPDYVDALVARATTRDPSLRPADAGVLLHHVHRVAAALREGVASDPELVADLLPSARVESDTTPEPVSSLWAGHPDLVDLGTHDPDHEDTSVIAPPAPATQQPGRTVPPPSPPARASSGRRRGRRVVAWSVLVALLLVAAGAGGYWFGWGRYTSTPGVVGLELAAAEAEIDDAGLASEVEEVYSETIEKGVVVSTDPGPGDRILPDDTVTLTVSLGPERYDLPDLRGRTIDEAEELLAEVKMTVGRRIERYSESVEKGRVIDSVPAHGSDRAQDLPVNTAVRLLISKGRKPIKVGNWVGKDADDALEALEKRGLVGEIVKRVHDDDVPEGDVISQDPRKGTKFKGDTVELVVSKGPELIEVPSVRYDSRDEAVEKLEDAGFKVKVERETIYINGAFAWRTNPEAGSKARKGSTIILYIV